MWVLEAEGEVLQGRRIWLRPGKKFLFGRTSAEAGQFALSDRTVSRRHLTVDVGEVGAKDCANIRTRSRITLEDLSTKHGTRVNDEQIRGKSIVLSQDQNVIIVGKCEDKLRFVWVPVTLTFSFGLKEAKADPFTALYDILGPLDIKILVEYQRGVTTHVVAKRRNTPKGLQALIDGKYIVHNDAFVNAIVAATTPVPSSEEGLEAKSSLEDDWNANFPNPLNYLPPRGEEPTERGDDAYAPSVDRRDVFEGYTFIFYERRQFDTLLAPINDGSGKAFFREVIPGEAEVSDFVRYVKDVAGEKGLGEFEDGSEGKGVVVVRFNPVKGAGIEWFANFNRDVALSLDHRLIEQNEFLDAILGNDASGLRRPLELEPPGTMDHPASGETVTSHTLQSSQPLPEPTPTPAEASQPEPVRRGRSRRTAASRFKGFDDDDDDPPINLNSIPEAPAIDQPVVEESQGLFVSQDPEMDIVQDEPEPRARTRSGRKRAVPPVEYEEEEENFMDQLAPAAAALKRRRMAEQTERRRRGEATPPVETIGETPEPDSQSKPVKKEIDVLELARTQREKAEELARKEREALQESLNGMDIQAIRNLAIIEEIEISRPPPPQRASREDESDRWDDKWNGRKNFKKFRRRGEAVDRTRDFHRVIVPLEEVKKKDFGIGDDYWLETDYQRRKKREKGQDAQGAFSPQSQPRAKTGSSTRAAEILADELQMLEEVDAGDLISSEVEIVELPPEPVAASRSQKSQRAVPGTSQKGLVANNKRPAATSLAKPAPAKKARQAAIRRKDESDDSDDEHRFRFRSRK
ncbi:hypothetical protein OIDMADRAFT_53864 [Oidiodendron maius Zn]|uniref:FHA domain-containing protein n=1 Tax=Oidiodendron maius (strain Zn) TaxID=913774 RepID=A0A0C3HGV8_OIDMZ|nr:hypothetical protein OIDMADRAFT_53864 [Oidiodendron maius Zn]